MRQEAWSDILESTTNLIAGYELNKDETRLTEVTITCPKNENNNAWHFNIGDEEGQSARQSPIQLPLSISDDLPIRPRYVEIAKSKRENE
ncbi:hypothetical protein DOJK_01673 [Patescibacteria group bacterium]|nr:hypothetical protein DOJK_01673 [Patescibacteria group bacterium]